MRVISSPPELGGEPVRAGWSEQALYYLLESGGLNKRFTICSKVVV